MKFGKCILHLNNVDSTNKYLIRFARNHNILDGTVIFTDKQSKGVGQFDKKWHSDEKSSLTISFYMSHQKPLEIKLPLLNMLFAYAVAKWLEDRTALPIKIKWPNDLIVNRKKLGGILIQNTFKGSGIHQTIFGLGINVSQKSFPKEIQDKATSIFLENRSSFSDHDLVLSLISTLNVYFDNYLPELENIIDPYNRFLLDKGRLLSFYNVKASKTFEGKIVGVNSDGNLVILQEYGQMTEWRNGEIRHPLSS